MITKKVFAERLSWTPPYCGVQHLSGHARLDGHDYQVTIEAYASVTSWYVVALRGGSPFSAIREGDCPTVAAAMREAEGAFLALVGEVAL
jgi:hypothetical protein